jgi:hypothetical protein
MEAVTLVLYAIFFIFLSVILNKPEPTFRQFVSDASLSMGAILLYKALFAL